MNASRWSLLANVWSDHFFTDHSQETTMKAQWLILSVLMTGLIGCSTVYYGTMERMGVHKREIMVDRVREARESQKEAKRQFLTAMEQFKSVVNFQGGDLEKEYNKLNTTLQQSESKAADVRNRISAIEDVSNALFREWSEEIKQYNSETLRKSSQQKYDATKKKYAELIKVMKRAEAKLEPALVPLRDQVLFMKHNLNARAIAGLSKEVIHVQTNVDKLVRDMERAIAQADGFIAALQAE
jgi:septal ring factor EnvC (AmiA/AmiB activator)